MTSSALSRSCSAWAASTLSQTATPKTRLAGVKVRGGQEFADRERDRLRRKDYSAGR